MGEAGVGGREVAFREMSLRAVVARQPPDAAGCPRGGGLMTSDQFDVKWTPGNAAGVSALLSMTDAGGREDDPDGPWAGTSST